MIQHRHTVELFPWLICYNYYTISRNKTPYNGNIFPCSYPSMSCAHLLASILYSSLWRKNGDKHILLNQSYFSDKHILLNQTYSSHFTWSVCVFSVHGFIPFLWDYFVHLQLHRSRQDRFQCFCHRRPYGIADFNIIIILSEWLIVPILLADIFLFIFFLWCVLFNRIK